MKLIIDDKRVRKLCEDPKHARKKLGPQVADKLQRRLQNLFVAESVFDVPPAFRPHALSGDRDGQFAVDIDKANRIVFEAADEPLPTDDSGGLDGSAVRIIRIVEIGDYHD